MPKNSYTQTILAAAHERRLVLFLGAGVSVPYGIPNWYDLAIELFLEDCGIAALLPDAAGSAIGGWIDSTFGYTPETLTRFLVERKDPLGKVRDALYRRLTRPPAGDCLSAIARFIGRSEDPENYGVRAVLTSNFDDLLERKLDEEGVKVNVAYGPWQADRVLPIVHVYGFLPQQGEIPEQHFVFNELEYSRLQKTDAWPNDELSYYMRHSTILFVGCSLNDPNIRRLLDLTRSDKPDRPHYIFRRRLRTDAATLDENLNDIRHRLARLDPTANLGGINPATLPALLKEIERREEAVLRQMGVCAIPIDSYAEIAPFFDANDLRRDHIPIAGRRRGS